MFFLMLLLTYFMSMLLLLLCTIFDIDKTYDGFRALAFANGLAVTWFAWLVLKVGVTIEVIVK